MNDLIKSQVKNVLDSYDLSEKDIIHFTGSSKIKVSPLTNSFYTNLMSDQLRQINYLKYRSKYLNKHSNVISQILHKYIQAKKKIKYINKYLGLHIRKPFIYDLDVPFKENRTNTKYSSKLRYLLSKYYDVNIGSNGEKYTFNHNIFENNSDNYFAKDVNIPDTYGRQNHSEKYMIKHRLTNQMDLVIVNLKGVFILEIKNYHSPTFTIKSSGRIYVRNKSGKEYPRMNVIDQNARHKVAMKEFLKAHGISHINVYAIVICANEDSKLKIDIPHIHIYKPTTFYPSFIDRQNDLLDSSTAKDIYNLLKNYSGPNSEQKFPEPSFITGFKDEFRKIFNYEREIFELDKLAYHTHKNSFRHYKYSNKYYYTYKKYRNNHKKFRPDYRRYNFSYPYRHKSYFNNRRRYYFHNHRY